MEGKSIRALYVAAWNDCENPALDGVNPHFQNRYATLASTLEKVREACKKHGIAYVQALQAPSKEGEGWALHSWVANGTDMMFLSVFPVSTDGNAQQFGSEMTYRKRQQAQADWGIVGEEDDDGEVSVTNEKQQKPERKATEKQVRVIAECYTDPTNLQQLLDYYNVNSLRDLTVKQASDVISQLKKN